MQRHRLYNILANERLIRAYIITTEDSVHNNLSRNCNQKKFLILVHKKILWQKYVNACKKITYLLKTKLNVDIDGKSIIGERPQQETAKRSIITLVATQKEKLTIANIYYIYKHCYRKNVWNK